MDIQDISATDLATLKAAGYQEGDLSMLAESEVKALLVPDTVDTPDRDPHDDAAAAQDDASAAAAAAAAAKPAATAPATTDDAAAAAAAAAAASAAEEEEAATTQPAATMPVLKAEVPADVDAQIKGLREKEEAEFKRLMDGLIDSDAYQAKKREFEAQIDTLRTQALTASIFNQVNQQTAEQAAQTEWKRAETAAMNLFKTEGLDYRSKPALLAAYNTHLKALGADAKNERKDAPWFLQEAHKLTKADLGITTTTKKSDGNSPAGVDPAELPPTLRGVPAAATGAVNGDEFAHMRNLSGVALERAHAALTEAQRDRWMAE
jgi:hypothetical protein